MLITNVQVICGVILMKRSAQLHQVRVSLRAVVTQDNQALERTICVHIKLNVAQHWHYPIRKGTNKIYV